MTPRKLLLGSVVALAMCSPALADDEVDQLATLEVVPTTCVNLSHDFPRVRVFQLALGKKLGPRYNEVGPAGMAIINRLYTLPMEARYEWCFKTREMIIRLDAQLWSAGTSSVIPPMKVECLGMTKAEMEASTVCIVH